MLSLAVASIEILKNRYNEKKKRKENKGGKIKE
jgi:hypothetical protein